MQQPFTDIDSYIASFPHNVQEKLEEIRTTIHRLAPDATEAIKYAILTFIWKGKNLVHFAAFKNHIGFYPAPSGISAFKKELAPYKQGKGSVQFPLDAKLPLVLIRRIAAFRLEENIRKEQGKK